MPKHHNAAPPRVLCPVCRQAMQTEHHGALLLDRCSQCAGLWFDHHELDAYFRMLPAGAEPVKAPEAVADADPLTCPRCQTETLRSYRAGSILISRCSSCEGMYLDGDDVRALGGKRPQYRRAENEAVGAAQQAGEIAGAVAGETIIEALMTAGFRAALTALKGL